jgi:RNA polymerase sigma-70 factor (ECF subfamily)
MAEKSTSAHPTTPGQARGSFATTHWTVVLAAGRSDSTRARDAMESLCRTYWYPLYAYVRRRGYSAADAEDLTQGFLTRLLELDSLADVRRERGKFRSFLLASLNHYLSDERDRASAAKRDARRTISLDAQAAETRYGREPVDPLTPERLFERQWALALLETVVQRLRGEYEGAGKGELFMALRFAITGGRSEVPYGELARQLGTTEPAIRVAVHRLRRRYRQVLRNEIAQTVATPQDVEDELRSLMNSLA